MNPIELETNEDDHEEMLNETFGDVEICGMLFDQGTALKELDPTAFRCSMQDAPILYKCGFCSEIHDDEEEAETCCKIECESCGDLHETYEEAENCCLEE